MESPADVSVVRQILGVIKELGKFTPYIADYIKPLGDLLSQKNQFYRGNPQQKAFDWIKTELTKSLVLALYDPNKYTVVAADSSSYGIGAVVIQKEKNGILRPCPYASRANA